MKFIVSRSSIKGTVEIPGSKSHSIRSFIFASLAEGVSIIRKPLLSSDINSAIQMCKLFGAKVHDFDDTFEIQGFAGKPSIPTNIIDVGNSGTTLRLALSTAALVDGYSIFTGDEQIRSRPVGQLLEALQNLGAQSISTLSNNKVPAIIKGRAEGGFTKLDGLSSQFLSSLLVNAPLFSKDTEIEMIRLYEIPYVDITTWWLDKLGIHYENHEYKRFYIKGGQSYSAFDMVIPADFSSATFFVVLAAISGGTIELKNLDMTDPQGDKRVFEIAEQMGCEVAYLSDSIQVTGRPLKGINVDINDIPDALPALAVMACFAEGETKFYNVLQARYKETDRIKVMATELAKMGASIEEIEDGLIIRESSLRGTQVHGYHDHRIVMALTLAGLCADGETTIDTAEAAGVTFPNFHELIASCGGKIRVEN